MLSALLLAAQLAGTIPTEPSNLPDQFRSLWRDAVTTGEVGKFASFSYRYAVSGDRAVAAMVPHSIAVGDKGFLAVVTDFAYRAFQAKLTATPELQQTEFGKALAFKLDRYTYYVLPIQNEKGEGASHPTAHTVLLWRAEPTG